MRIALGVEYNGRRYHGWQCQPGLYTVQAELEQAIGKIAGENVSVVCAGRTDTGVHATGQVVHFDTSSVRNQSAWIFGVNNYLPRDITVTWVKQVSDDFHARFSAKARRYQYVIFNRNARSAVFSSCVTWHYKNLDAQTMHEGAKCLLGEHDFSSFRSVECQSKTAMRDIRRISVKRYQDFIVIDMIANAFLHHMVRNIAGVLMRVGSGKEEPSWVADVLAARDRSLGAETAPPYGLYLVDVQYPESYALDNHCLFPFAGVLMSGPS